VSAPHAKLEATSASTKSKLQWIYFTHAE